MISNSLAKIIASACLALMLLVVTASADINVSGDPTGTYSGGATTTYSGPNQGGGGGGSGGGGGGISAENFSNIELKEKHDMYIFKDRVTSYVFTSSGSPIMYVNITGNSSAGEVMAAIEVLKDTSMLVTSSAPGSVYRNVNVWVGTSGFASQKNIKESVIVFRVLNSWLEGNGISAIKMDRWDGTTWVQLETEKKSRGDEYTYFEAKTTAFGNFAITGAKSESIPASAPVLTEKKPAPTEDIKKDTAGFEFYVALIALIAICLYEGMRR